MKRFLVPAVAIAAFAYAACGGSSGSGTGTLTAPTNLTGAQMGSGVHLTWKDNATNETGYDVERASATGSFVKVATVTFDTAQYHDQGNLTPGEAYVWRVRAVGEGSATSAYSNEVTVNAPAGTGGGAGGGSGGGAGGGGGFDGLADGGYSFQQHIIPVFNSSCGAGDNSCHSRIAYGPTTSGQCRGWLALENASLGSVNPTNQQSTGCPDRTLYQRLTQLDAWMCDNPRMKYVVPSDLSKSLIYQVIGGDPSQGGTCQISAGVNLGAMPKSPYTLDAASRNKIKVWIEQGAPNN